MTIMWNDDYRASNKIEIEFSDWYGAELEPRRAHQSPSIPFKPAPVFFFN